MNRVHVALFLAFTFFAPTVKEKISTLFTKSTPVTAFLGDGILVADSSNYAFPWFPFISINFTLEQQPIFGDAYHTISFFVVPKQIAQQFLYTYDVRNFTSDPFFVDGGKESVRDGLHHLNLRSNIYLLPQEYTGPEKEARAEIKVHFTQISSGNSSANSVRACSPVCQFQNRALYSDFLDMEPNAMSGVECTPPFRDFQICDFNEASDVFTSKANSYNFFSAVVPTKSYVQYKTDIVMYFYDQRKLARYFQCKVRGIDTCSFILRPSETYLIIAYIHPNSAASELTTTISVTVDVLVWQAAAYFLVCLLTPLVLIRVIFL